MKDDFKFEELDDLFSKVNKKDIEIPNKLDTIIDEKIKSLKPEKSIFRKVLVACVLIGLMFVGGVRFSDTFSIYASQVPGLKLAVDLIRGDKGIKNAYEKGYKEIIGTTIEENGYILNINDIFIDEDRMSFNAYIKGDKIKALIDKELDIKDDIYMSIEIKEVKSENFLLGSEPIHEYDFARKFELVFKEGTVEEFIKKDPESLDIKVKIMNGKELIHEFNDIKLNLEEDSIKLSRKINLNKEINFEYGKINIEKLTISPTRMKLNLKFDFIDKYNFNSFENYYLKDEKGNIYKPEGLVSRSTNEHEKILYFVPSTYFEEAPENLQLVFEGIRIYTDEGRKFKLNINDDYPKVIKYMGEEILIEKVIRTYGDRVMIVAQLPNENKLTIQNFNLVGNNDGIRWGDYSDKNEKGEEIKYHESSFKCERDEFEVEIQFPGYLIKENKIIDLNTK